MSGECAIYTMRKMETRSDGDLRDKFQKMQRRASLAVRQHSVVNDAGGVGEVTTIAERRRSVALAMVPGGEARSCLSRRMLMQLVE